MRLVGGYWRDCWPEESLTIRNPKRTALKTELRTERMLVFLAMGSVSTLSVAVGRAVTKGTTSASALLPLRGLGPRRLPKTKPHAKAQRRKEAKPCFFAPLRLCVR